jgi:hypothetical protein
MDRLTSMGISNAAKEFLKAAKILHKNDMTLSAPLYFAACQSIELSLKGFLRGSGYTDKQLRDIGHNLIKAVAHAQALGLDQHFQFSQEDAMMLHRINPYYQTKELQYVIAGFKSYPMADAFIDFGQRLWTSTRKFCVANRSVHEGKPSEITTLRKVVGHDRRQRRQAG